MKAVTEEVVYCEAILDTPFGAPVVRTNSGEVRGPNSALEAFTIPGCHVKSREMDGRWPRYFGRLVSCENDVYVVASKPPAHGVDGKPTVWTGTFSEYAAMWRCD